VISRQNRDYCANIATSKTFVISPNINMGIPLKNLLGDAVKRAGIGQGVLAARVVEEFQKICRELYGSDTCQAISHASYRQGVLKVKCEEAVVAQNLRFNKTRIINELNQALQQRTVRDLKILIA
jgi:hypothetical protein